jgi:hypothetical protein
MISCSSIAAIMARTTLSLDESATVTSWLMSPAHA